MAVHGERSTVCADSVPLVHVAGVCCATGSLAVSHVSVQLDPAFTDVPHEDVRVYCPFTEIQYTKIAIITASTNYTDLFYRRKRYTTLSETT